MSPKFLSASRIPRLAILILLIIVSYNTNGQSFIKASVDVAAEKSNELKIFSPTASAFSEYVVNPVGYYTGVPLISVDVYQVKLKDFTLPISLTYHSGGIKIEETASNVGLNWNLTAMGIITRAVKDKPDDTSIEFCDEIWYEVGPTGGTPPPTITENSRCGNGLLWALNYHPFDTTNYKGLFSYNIDLSNFNGAYRTNKSSAKLLKMFYAIGIQHYTNSENMYLLSMADREPDIYYFNFPGHSGEFVFDLSTGAAKVKIVPYQDLKIDYTIDARKKLSAFKITDEQGIIYSFNAVEVTTQDTRANQRDVDGGLDQVWDTQVRNFDTGNSTTKYTTSWFLTRIKTPAKDSLDFTYADEEYKISNNGPQQTGMYYYNPAGTKASLYNPNETDTWGYYMSLIMNETTIATKRISTIESNDVKISFNATHERQDLVPGSSTPGFNLPYAINEIIVYNKIGALNRVKRFSLKYDYFQSDATERIKIKSAKYPGYYEFNVQDSSKYYKRLRLLSFQEFGKDDNSKIEPYKFEYKYYDFTGNNSHKLPHRLSYQQDIWGFYNAATTNKTLIPSLYVYPDHYSPRDSRQFSFFKKNTYTGAEYPLPGANRLPNSSVQDIGMISKIVYPTGGYTQYQFEPHVFRYEGQDYSGAGLRIKQIVKSDNENSTSNLIYNYSYINPDNTSSGAIISLPILAVRHLNFCCGGLPDPNSIQSYKVATTRYSVPQANLSSTNGSFVGYRTVTEYIQGNGKSVFTYSMHAAWNIENDKPSSIPGGVCDPQADGFCDGFYERTPVVDIFVPVDSLTLSSDLVASNYDFQYNPAAPNTFPFPDNPNYDWQRGHLLTEKIYDNANRLLAEKLYAYTNYFPNSQNNPTKIYGYKFASHYPLLYGGNRPKTYVFRAAKYTILADVAKMLLTKKEILHNADDVTKKFETTTTFSYGNPNHTQITKIITTDSRNRSLQTVNFHPGDLSGTTLGSDLLRQKHINNIVLRQEFYIDQVLKAKSETKYELKSQIALPTTAITYSDGATESSRTISDYDTQGNAVSIAKTIDTDPNGATVFTGANISYIWGYNKKLPIAEVTNALSNQIFHTSFEDIVDANVISTDSKTGQRCWNGSYTIPIELRPVVGNYTLTYWEKIGVGQWLPKIQTISNAVPTQITSTGKIDEVRIFPVGSAMTTYTHDPLIGVTSKTDPNNITEFYTYDGLGRLKLVLDFDGNILKQYDYNYKLKK
jgi:YD repeat-containing protein